MSSELSAVLFAAAATSPARAALPAFEDASDRLLGVVNHSLASGGSGYAGVAVLDYDNDGWLDLYFPDGPGHDNRLLRNDGTGHFVDVTADAGVAVGTGSRGALAADLDGNGATDLVLTGDLAAPMRVLFNSGDGRFVDVSVESGLRGASRNVSAHAADVDGDGWLDVYVAAGVLPSQEIVNTLYHNRGDGTFEEVAATAGVATAFGACAATFLHLDDDDAIDLLVANCGGDGGELLPFEVYRNRGDGTFEDVYPTAKIWALGHFMGLAVGDYDGDLRFDVFATNSGIGRGQPHALYRPNGDGSWSDVAPTAGVSDWEFGWGTAALDADLDGNVDLYYTGRSQVGDRYAAPGHLFRNAGDGTFELPVQPLDLSASWTSGVAAADVDNDGGVDLVVTRTEVVVEGASGAAVLLHNGGGTGHHWVTVRPVGAFPNPGAIGARVYARAGERLTVAPVEAGSSYQSTGTPWPTFGLGEATDVDVCVRWPDGTSEWFDVGIDAVVAVVAGEGVDGACTDGATTAHDSDSGGAPEVPSGDGGGDPAGRCGCGTTRSPALGWGALAALLVRRRAGRAGCSG